MDGRTGIKNIIVSFSNISKARKAV